VRDMIKPSTIPLSRHLSCQLVGALLMAAMLSACATRGVEPSTVEKKDGKSAPHLDEAQADRIKRMMVTLIHNMNKPIPLSEVKIAVIDDQSINAANAGKGQFYVTAGLLDKANDEQLFGVLAHEVAHEDLGHVAKAKVVGTGVNIGVMILSQIVPGSGLIAPAVAKLAVQQPFSRQEEYQADQHAVDILNRAGYNGKQIVAGALTWLLKTSGPSGGFLSDHPGTSDRIKRVEQLP